MAPAYILVQIGINFPLADSFYNACFLYVGALMRTPPDRSHIRNTTQYPTKKQSVQREPADYPHSKPVYSDYDSAEDDYVDRDTAAHPKSNSVKTNTVSYPKVKRRDSCHDYYEQQEQTASSLGSVLSNADSDTRGRFDSDSETSLSCLLYTSPSPRDGLLSRMPSSA